MRTIEQHTVKSPQAGTVSGSVADSVSPAAMDGESGRSSESGVGSECRVDSE